MSRTRILVMTLGASVGAAAAIHGIFEIAKGNVPVSGADLLKTVGAFTVIPNYAWAGIATLVVAACMVAWTFARIHRRYGPTVFLLLAIVLFLVGGGVAQLLLFVLTWALSTRIRSPFAWWEKAISVGSRRRLARLWVLFFVAGCALLLAGMGIWLLALPPGRPGFDRVTPLHYVDWAFLATGLLLLVAAMIAGFCADIEKRKAARPT